jgi:pantothenate kinase
LDSLSEGLQEYPTLKYFVSLDIGLKCIISDYNQGHIIWELRTRGTHDLNDHIMVNIDANIALASVTRV